MQVPWWVQSPWRGEVYMSSFPPVCPRKLRLDCRLSAQQTTFSGKKCKCNKKKRNFLKKNCNMIWRCRVMSPFLASLKISAKNTHWKKCNMIWVYLSPFLLFSSASALTKATTNVQKTAATGNDMIWWGYGCLPSLFNFFSDKKNQHLTLLLMGRFLPLSQMWGGGGVECVYLF